MQDEEMPCQEDRGIDKNKYNGWWSQMEFADIQSITAIIALKFEISCDETTEKDHADTIKALQSMFKLNADIGTSRTGLPQPNWGELFRILRFECTTDYVIHQVEEAADPLLGELFDRLVDCEFDERAKEYIIQEHLTWLCEFLAAIIGYTRAWYNSAVEQNLSAVYKFVASNGALNLDTVAGNGRSYSYVSFFAALNLRLAAELNFDIAVCFEDHSNMFWERSWSRAFQDYISEVHPKTQRNMFMENVDMRGNPDTSGEPVAAFWGMRSAVMAFRAVQHTGTCVKYLSELFDSCLRRGPACYHMAVHNPLARAISEAKFAREEIECLSKYASGSIDVRKHENEWHLANTWPSASPFSGLSKDKLWDTCTGTQLRDLRAQIEHWSSRIPELCIYAAAMEETVSGEAIAPEPLDVVILAMFEVKRWIDAFEESTLGVSETRNGPFHLAPLVMYFLNNTSYHGIDIGDVRKYVAAKVRAIPEDGDKSDELSARLNACLLAVKQAHSKHLSTTEPTRLLMRTLEREFSPMYYSAMRNALAAKLNCREDEVTEHNYLAKSALEDSAFLTWMISSSRSLTRGIENADDVHIRKAGVQNIFSDLCKGVGLREVSSMARRQATELERKLRQETTTLTTLKLAQAESDFDKSLLSYYRERSNPIEKCVDWRAADNGLMVKNALDKVLVIDTKYTWVKCTLDDAFNALSIAMRSNWFRCMKCENYDLAVRILVEAEAAGAINNQQALALWPEACGEVVPREWLSELSSGDSPWLELWRGR
jgi:hypothetical protein